MLDFSVIVVMRISLYLLFFTGGFLLIRMLQTRLYNLFGLVMFFILYPMQLLFSIYFHTMLSLLLIDTYYIFLALFVKQTFYREQNGSYFILLYVIISLRVYEFALQLIFNFQTAQIPPTNLLELVFYYMFLISKDLQEFLAITWLVVASFSNFRNLRGKDIKYWIKTRYLIIGLSSSAFYLTMINSIVIMINQSYTDTFSIILSVVTITIFSFGNLIAWIFPKVIPKNMVKEPSFQEEELPEHELIIKIKKELSFSRKNGNN